MRDAIKKGTNIAGVPMNRKAVAARRQPRVAQVRHGRRAATPRHRAVVSREPQAQLVERRDVPGRRRRPPAAAEIACHNRPRPGLRRRSGSQGIAREAAAAAAEIRWAVGPPRTGAAAAERALLAGLPDVAAVQAAVELPEDGGRSVAHRARLGCPEQLQPELVAHFDEALV